MGQFFAYTLFQYLKKYPYKSQNNMAEFFADPLFQIFKRSILVHPNLKIRRTTFCLYIF